MADEQPSAARQITGDDILFEIQRNCEAGAFKIRYTVILPCIYHVYLHAADYDLIKPVIPAVTAEARAALIERLEELSAAAKPSSIARKLGFDSGKQIEYKIIDPDWTIEFHSDAEDKLARGEIEIYSELASTARQEFEGAMTRHITRRLPENQTTSTKVTAPTASGGKAYAYIRFQDNGSQQSFAVTKNQVVIGRGGKSFSVDIKLSAPPDVSREHCRIRRDEANGRFYIRDVSQYGTLVNGSRIPSDNSIEVPLPARCRITLADVFDLDFEAVESG